MRLALRAYGRRSNVDWVRKFPLGHDAAGKCNTDLSAWAREGQPSLCDALSRISHKVSLTCTKKVGAEKSGAAHRTALNVWERTGRAEATCAVCTSRRHDSNLHLRVVQVYEGLLTYVYRMILTTTLDPRKQLARIGLHNLYGVYTSSQALLWEQACFEM